MGLLTPVATGITAFHLLGACFAAWALIVAFLGITREGFPTRGVEARLVGAISVLLAVGAIASAIIVGALEAKKEEEAEAEAEAKAEPPEAGGQRLELVADPSGLLAFDKRTLRARPGNVTVAMRNPSVEPHNVVIQGNGVDRRGRVVLKGGTSTVTAELRPGEYVFYCSVDGHRQAGMEGELVVR
jgi:plastocyanin